MIEWTLLHVCTRNLNFMCEQLNLASRGIPVANGYNIKYLCFFFFTGDEENGKLC